MKSHSNFVHLHNHTNYSLLDGACLINRFVKEAAARRMPALAITDHGNMFGAIEFYEACMKEGLKPIIGCEAYVAPESRFEKSSLGIQEASYHLILLARDDAGYKNLMKLVSAGFLEGFYYRPRIDKELLAKHAKGLIGLSSCLKGEIPYLLLKGQTADAEKAAGFFLETFGKGNFYLELMENKLKEQADANRMLIELGRRLQIPMVATNDVHYLEKEHSRAHEALLCIQTQTSLTDPNRMRFQTDEFYFKTADQMRAAFKEIPEAADNTLEIAEKCNIELDFTKTHLPHYTPPGGKTREGYLKELVDEGLSRRYAAVTPEIRQRTEHELKVIDKAGYTSYFLIAWDFVHYAKSKGIPVGPGRGSAAGSVTSYALGITDIDPLKYNLLFERFLNPERVSLPDIDIDFCYERRSEIIDYVIQKYSKDNVAQVITFGTMLAKAVVRDVARVMNFPYADADRIAKLIPADLGITLKEALEQVAELSTMHKTDERIRELFDISTTLEGLTRHASTHAAGVVIAEEPLTEYIPLYKAGEQISTGYPMGALEKIGLLKMDFLGLRNLTVIDETIKIIRKRQGIDLDLERVPIDDPKTFKLLAGAESVGVFQLESAGMRDILKKLKPDTFEDLIAVLALFRPGPLGSGMVDDFIKRKHGHIPIRYDHPLLEPILKSTYGVCIFQEQIMQIVAALAGFSLSQADSLRRAISKKIPEIMAQQRHHFIEGAARRGVDKKTADKVFNMIEYFAGYGFNKSHSTAYAMISYRTAYLKANFPMEYMTALLSSEKDNLDKIVVYIDECSRMGIRTLPPDVNESVGKFTIVEDGIRFGLSAIKNVGQGAIDSVVESRKREGAFPDIFELCQRVDSRLVNHKVLESLIKCGACDSLGLKRSQMMAVLDKAIEAASGIQKDKTRGQLSFFDSRERQNGFRSSFRDVPQIEEWPENQLLAYEKQLLGFYVTKHPLARYEKMLKLYSTGPTASAGTLKEGQDVIMGGIIAKAKFTTTKRTNERMAIINLEDLEGTIEVLVFPKVFTQYFRYVKPDAIVFIKGRLSLRDGEPKILASEVLSMEEVQEKYTKALAVRLITAGLEDETLTSLKDILKSSNGPVPVYLRFVSPDRKETEVLVDREYFVHPSDTLIHRIEELLGDNVVQVRG